MPERVLDYERVLVVLALGVGSLLAVEDATALAIETGLVGGGFCAAVVRLRRASWRGAARLRLALAYPIALWAYLGPARWVPALHRPPLDSLLLSLDEALLGATPAAGLSAWSRPALTDLLSLCYLAYLLYLHGASLWALAGPLDRARQLAERVFLVLAAGPVGYLLVPALGPGPAFPDRWGPPLEGGWPTALNAWVVEHGSSQYDAFPSLHVAVTLSFDRQHHPLRWRLMVPISVGLIGATLYLRYHYAVDLAAGVILAAMVRAATRPPAAVARRASAR